MPEPSKDELLQAAAEHMGSYVAIKQQMDGLATELAGAREALLAVLFPEGPVAGAVFEFEGLGTVTGVKGRVSTELDRAVLARGGVDPALLDKATVTKTGKPSVRIEVDDAAAPPEGVPATPPAEAVP